MQIYNLQNDLPVFGVQVTTFPLGISEAFASLAKMIPGGPERPYYGISYFTKDGKVVYKATALEKFEGEAEKYHCEKYIIGKGGYLTETIYDWRNKLDSIKEVFHELMKDGRIDNTRPCVEWYKTDEEMLCMIKLREA